MRFDRVASMLFMPPRAARRRTARFALRYSWAIIAVAGLSANAILVSGLSGLAVDLPDPPDISRIAPLAQTTHIVDREGRPIAALYGEEHRIIVPLDEIPEHVQRAVLAIEDDDFFTHGGIDLAAVARAVAANLAEGKVVQGASTVTQQLVRNAFDDIGRERTLARKIEEARAALELEKQWSKDEILERYLNTVYFGRGAYGVEAAAQTYFGRSIRRVTVAQAALLAGVIHAPGSYTDDEERARSRRDLVLSRMLKLGWMSPEGYERSRAVGLGLEPPSADREVRAAYFVEHVRRLLKLPEVDGGFGLTDRQILTGGLTVHTTLDLSMQRAAERAVRQVLNRKGDPEVGLVAMTTTGEIRAMVGGRRFRSLARARGFNYAAQRVEGGGRQAGSAFKPFTLAAYLEQGGDPSASYRAPSRIEIEDCGKPDEPWEPANYQEQSFGSLSVVEATEKSANTVYAQMIDDIDPRTAMSMAQRLGVTSPLEPVCSISLGTFGVTPLEMARAYSSFAARGRRPEVIAVTSIVEPDGSVVANRKPVSTPVLDREVADTVNAILERVVTRGTGTPARISRPAAGKTGTTEEHRDVWFVGYTPHPGISAAVWMGHPPDRNGRIKPMTTLRGRVVTGGGFAGDIWRRFMERALGDEPAKDFRDADLSSSSSEGSSITGQEPRRSIEVRRERATEPGNGKKKKRRREHESDPGRSEPDPSTPPGPPEPEDPEPSPAPSTAGSPAPSPSASASPSPTATSG